MEVSEQTKTGKNDRQVYAYPSPEEKERLQSFADRTRRSMSQALIYLALAQLDEIEAEKATP